MQLPLFKNKAVYINFRRRTQELAPEGILINKKRLNHIRYADDIVLIADNPAASNVDGLGERIIDCRIEDKFAKNKDNV